MAQKEELRVGFFGSGMMATALAKGFVNSGLVLAKNVIGSDVTEGALRRFENEVGKGEVKTTIDNLEVLKQAEVLFISVKPDQVTPLLNEISSHFEPRHLLISIAAGVTLEKLSKSLSTSLSFSSPPPRIVRVMPNTPALVGASASAFSLPPSPSSEKDAKLVERLLSGVGIAARVDEKLLDAVTGLSGSGPAYIYLAIEALSDGGVAAGLPREIATRFAAQTVLGSAKMVLDTGLHPGQLKDMVTSPGGTTIEGVHELEKGGMRASFINAVRAASEKATELGKK
jgi:pyrroline-5-carboxylate reductase